MSLQYPKLTSLLWCLFFVGSVLATPEDSLQVQNHLNSTKRTLYSNPDSAEFYALSALELAQTANLTKQEAHSLLLLGILGDVRSDYLEGIKYLNKALLISQENGFKQIEGSVTLNLGNIHYNLVNPMMALDFFYQAEKIFTELGDDTHVGSALNNIAVILKDLKDREKAIEYYKKSLELARRTGNERGEMNVLNNMAVVYLEMGELDKAYSILLDQNERYNREGGVYDLAKNQYNLARAYVADNKNQQAKDTLLKAYNNFESFNNIEGMIGSAYVFAEIYLSENNLKQADFWIKKDVALCKDSQLNSFLAEALMMKADIQIQAGNYEVASEALFELAELNDSLADNRRQELILGMQAAFESEKQQMAMKQLLHEREMEKEISNSRKSWLTWVSILSGVLVLALTTLGYFYLKNRKYSTALKEKNDFIARQMRQLEDLNQAKNRMFSIVAHDFKSPLASMQPALKLINDKEVEGEEKEFLLNSLLNVVEIADFNMENLFHWAKGQMSGLQTQKEELSLNSILSETLPMYRLMLRFKEVDLKTNVEDNLTVYADANQVRFVLRNLIHNAIKFTFQKGLVYISAYSSGQETVLLIKDDGMGMPEMMIKELEGGAALKSVPGTKQEMGSGLGLQLSYQYLSENDANVSIESTEGKGTEFKIVFPATRNHPIVSRA